MNVFPPQGVVNARVIVSPGHLKRMIRALQESLQRFEMTRGRVVSDRTPDPSPRPPAAAG